MIRKTIYTFCFIALTLFLGSEAIFAGFGITPPYVKNDSLTRNSIYEQRIIIVRGSPTIDLKAQIAIDVPGANEWISIDKGEEFLLPRGEQRVPIVVRVQVPKKADFKNYTGNIRIRTAPADGSRTGSGAVSIALGAQIDVRIDVVDKKIYDFRVRRIRLFDLNEGRDVAWLSYPGKIRFAMHIENTGNMAVAPSRVDFNIYDAKGETLLHQTKNTNRIKKVQPFETKEVIAELPTHLPAGSYIVRYSIFNSEDIKQEGELNLSVRPYGTLDDDSGYGFMGLSLFDKATLVVPILIVIAIVVFSFIKIRRRRKI